jgi:hypothetical protein
LNEGKKDIMMRLQVGLLELEAWSSQRPAKGISAAVGVRFDRTQSMPDGPPASLMKLLAQCPVVITPVLCRNILVNKQ